jgi:hypothetical protein
MITDATVKNINFDYFKNSVIQHVQGMGCAGYMRNTLRETQYRVKTKHLCFSYCVGAFPGNKGDWWIKDF